MPGWRRRRLRSAGAGETRTSCSTGSCPSAGSSAARPCRRCNRDRERSIECFSKVAFSPCRRIHPRVIVDDDDDDPKRRRESPFPLSLIRDSHPRRILSPTTRDRLVESGIVPVVHAPITICLHEILGFFFRDDRREKISPRGFTYRTGNDIQTRMKKTPGVGR